jgi:hypothetical protein
MKPDLHTLVPARFAPKRESGLRDSGERLSQVVEAAHLAQSQKRALHTTVHDATRPTREIAELAGVSYQFLCNAALESTKDQLPFSRLPLVLRYSDNLTLLRLYASLQGCDVIRMPRVGATADEVHRASATMREFAQFMDASADALEDATVAPEEFATIEREGLEAVRAILASIAAHRARVQRPLFDRDGGW